MTISKETKIGVIVVLGTALMVWGLNFLKGKNLFSSEQKYVAIYSRISSLVEGNPVQINGFKVGQVSKVYFHPDGSGKVVVVFSIVKETVKLPFDTEAMIYSSDLLGSKAIELVLGKDTAFFLQPGDTLLSSVEMELAGQVNAQIAPLKKKTEELISSVDSAVTIVQHILNKDVMEHIGKGFESFQRSLLKFEKIATNLDDVVMGNKDKLNDIFSKIQSITVNFNNNNEQLTNVIQNLSAISDSVAKADFATTLNNVNAALNASSEIMMKINNGEGTLSLLLNDDKLYNELSMAAIDLNMLLLDMRLNPGRYMPLKRKGKLKEVERDSVYYKNMMKINREIIGKIKADTAG